MIYYLIRHKATGLFMPQAKRDRGYSHWNPAVHIDSFDKCGMLSALSVPRLIDTRGRAARCIHAWANNPNGRRSLSSPSYYTGEQDDIVDIKPDGRKANDLEVVEVDIIEVKNET